MREIKFRAWYKYAEKMLQVSEIRLLTGPFMQLVLAGESPVTSFRAGDNVELMQFTGLKDTKGTEIYEGDILEIVSIYSKRYAQVLWAVYPHAMTTWEQCEAWMLQFSDVSAPLYPYCQIANGYDVFVVGNIHEHPELLTKDAPPSISTRKEP
jgi:uncharacterized phage protein (TIGR01671 family)